MRRFLMLFFLLAILGLAAIGWGYWQIIQLPKSPIQHAPQQLLTIPKGTNSKTLAQLLRDENIFSAPYSDYSLPLLLKLKPALGRIKAGTYALTDLTTLEDLLKHLNSGKEAQFNVQFIEGQTFKQWRKNLENAPHLQQTLRDKSDAEILALLNLPEYAQNAHKWATLDGLLAAETYSYTPNSTDLALLQRAARRLQQTLESAWQNRAADLPLNNPYEMLILASIVEKETAIHAEKARVAGVFVNRLNIKMKLQTDPTVIYGMGETYQGNIRKRDLQTPTPYNTYVIDGLPPTPIAMISETTLQSVAQPEKHHYLYFVADGNGGHKFSRTLSEHNRAVQEYLRWYRSQQK